MGQEVSAFADRHVGKESDFAKNTTAFNERHFGKNSDLKKNIDKHFGKGSDLQKLQKLLPFGPKPLDAFLADDRLFDGTKKALKARPEVKFPSATSTQKKIVEGWKKFSAEQAKTQGEWSGLPPSMSSDVTRVERMAQGVNICITRKKDVLDGPVVVYMHGGGFAAGSFNDHAYKNYIYRLAALGKCTVISIDFSLIPEKSFTDALGDCIRVTKATSMGKITGVKESPVLLAGNSTGGMLALATAIRANQRGWVKSISGIYTISPFVDGVSSGNKYPSMNEFNGYNISEEYLQAWLGSVKSDMEANPNMFPINATHDDLKGLPPTKIIVFQLDMLRDMGIAMHFRLMKAGVQATFTIVSGGVHDQQLFYNHSPEVTEASVNDLAQFSSFAEGQSGSVPTKPKTAAVTSVAEDDKSVTSTTSKGRGRSKSPSAAKAKASTTSKSSSVKSTEKLIAKKKVHVESNEVSDFPDDMSVRSSRSTKSTRSSSSAKSAKSVSKQRSTILSRPPPSLPDRASKSTSDIGSTVAKAKTVASSAR